jgi:hypothetical protein
MLDDDSPSPKKEAMACGYPEWAECHDPRGFSIDQDALTSAAGLRKDAITPRWA